jgi:hypothetical protein
MQMQSGHFDEVINKNIGPYLSTSACAQHAYLFRKDNAGRYRADHQVFFDRPADLRD